MAALSSPVSEHSPWVIGGVLFLLEWNLLKSQSSICSVSNESMGVLSTAQEAEWGQTSAILSDWAGTVGAGIWGRWWGMEWVYREEYMVIQGRYISCIYPVYHAVPQWLKNLTKWQKRGNRFCYLKIFKYWYLLCQIPWKNIHFVFFTFLYFQPFGGISCETQVCCQISNLIITKWIPHFFAFSFQFFSHPSDFVCTIQSLFMKFKTTDRFWNSRCLNSHLDMPDEIKLDY